MSERQVPMSQWQTSAGRGRKSRSSDLDRLGDPVSAAVTGAESGAVLQRSWRGSAAGGF